MPRSSTYYQARPRTAKVDEVLAQRIKHLIDDEPYLDIAWSGRHCEPKGCIVNRKAVQRIMQFKGWQCHRRLHKSCYPRVEVSSSIAAHSDERWATDFTCVWTSTTAGLCQRSHRLRRSVRRRLLHQQAMPSPRGGLGARGCVHQALRRSSTWRRRRSRAQRQRFGLRLTALPASALIVRLRQEFIHPHTPEQNGVVEAYHKTFKRECVWQHRFVTPRTT